MEESYVINQHYIPQCLLKFFSNDRGKVFETLVEVGKVYPASYKSSMVERYTYEHPNLEKNKVEKYFHKIESYIGIAIERIIHIIEKQEKQEVAFSTVKAAVSQYMREFLIFYYRSNALLTEFEFQRNNKSDRVLLMLKNILNSAYIRELSRTVINATGDGSIMSHPHVAFSLETLQNKGFSLDFS